MSPLTFSLWSDLRGMRALVLLIGWTDVITGENRRHGGIAKYWLFSQAKVFLNISRKSKIYFAYRQNESNLGKSFLRLGMNIISQLFLFFFYVWLYISVLIGEKPIVYCASKLIENLKLCYKSNRPHFLWVYRHDNRLGIFGSWFTNFPHVLPTSCVVYHAGKPIG